MAENLGIQSREQHLTNLKRELDIFVKDKEDTTTAVKAIQKRLELSKAAHEIKFNNFRTLKDKVLWEYELIPEYVNLIRDLQVLDAEDFVMRLEAQIKMGEDKLVKIQEQIDSAQKEISRLEKVMKNE